MTLAEIATGFFAIATIVVSCIMGTWYGPLRVPPPGPDGDLSELVRWERWERRWSFVRILCTLGAFIGAILIGLERS